MSQKKRKQISIEEKSRIISKLESGTPNKDLAKKYGVPHSTISTIWKEREKIKTLYDNNCLKMKRARTTKHTKIEEALLKWFKCQRMNNVPINGPILQQKANDFARRFGEDFVCSSSWIQRFRARHGIVGGNMSGEAVSLDDGVVEGWISRKGPTLCEGDGTDAIFNANETGLFYNMTPDRTLKFKEENCAGEKMSKTRPTTMVAANMTGSSKRKLSVVGKSKKPRCFKNIHYLPPPVTYEDNLNHEKKRKQINIEEKSRIISKLESGTPNKDLAMEYGVPHSTISTIWKEREKIKTLYDNNCLKMKRARTMKHTKIEEALLKWFKCQRMNNGPILQQKANDFARRFGEDFVCSSSWIQRFRARHGIVGGNMSGEAVSLDDGVVEGWISRKGPTLCEGDGTDAIFNANETGLFYNMTPDRTLKFKEENCAGEKMSKTRPTTMVAANMTGCSKRKLSVVGKSKKPRCFKNIHYLPPPVTYEDNLNHEKKRKQINIEEKSRIISKLESGTPNKDLAMEYGVPHSTISTIWKEREKIKTLYDNNCLKRIRVRTMKHRKIEEALLKWFKCRRKNNVPINGPILQQKANDFARRFGEDFVCSSSWINRFRARHSIVSEKMSVEAASLHDSVVEDWISQKRPTLCEGYGPEFKEENCSGEKLSKKRLTIIVAANMTGSRKRKLLVVEKSKKPRCFKNIPSLPPPVTYGNNVNHEKKRKQITIEEKSRIISKLESGTPNKDLAMEYSVPHSTISTIWKKREKIKTLYDKNCLKMKRARTTKHTKIEEALLKWFKYQSANNVPINGPILQQKAKDFATQFGDDFICSSSWIQRFRARHGIVRVEMSGEAASVDDGVVEENTKA